MQNTAITRARVAILSLVAIPLVLLAVSVPKSAVSAGASRSRLVVIYIGNTPNEPRLAEMLNWIGDSKDQSVQKTISRVRDDLAGFPPVAAKEMADLKATATKSPDAFNLVLVSTPSLQQGIIEYVKAGDSAVYKKKIAARERSAHLGAQPLTSAIVFEEVLLAIEDIFDPKAHEFLMITKSHGNETMALTSVLAGKVDIDSAARLMAALNQSVKTGLAKNENVSPTKGRSSTLDFSTNSTLDFSTNSTLAVDEELGVRKDTFVDILVKAGDRGMRFDLVVLGSCNSHLTDAQAAKLKPFTKCLASSSHLLKYAAYNYAELIAIDQNGSFSNDKVDNWSKLNGFDITRLIEGTRRVAHVALSTCVYWR